MEKIPVPTSQETAKENLSEWRKFSEDLRHRMEDPNYLPRYEDLKKVAAVLQEYRRHRTHERRVAEDSRPYKPPEVDSELREWNTLLKHTYEVINQEYVEHLASYLVTRFQKFGTTGTVLEVGAGNGRLSHFLQQELAKQTSIRVVGTDSGGWGIGSDFPVEKITNEEALKKYQPKIVLSSWMPHGEDFTASFRQETSVQEYLLIGDFMGACGKEWETYGAEGYLTKSEYKEKLERQNRILGRHDRLGKRQQKPLIPPYLLDGFEKAELPELELWQVSHQSFRDMTDDTGTFTFRRIKDFDRSMLQPGKNNFGLGITALDEM